MSLGAVEATLPSEVSRHRDMWSFSRHGKVFFFGHEHVARVARQELIDGSGTLSRMRVYVRGGRALDEEQWWIHAHGRVIYAIMWKNEAFSVQWLDERGKNELQFREYETAYETYFGLLSDVGVILHWHPSMLSSGAPLAVAMRPSAPEFTWCTFKFAGEEYQVLRGQNETFFIRESEPANGIYGVSCLLDDGFVTFLKVDAYRLVAKKEWHRDLTRTLTKTKKKLGIKTPVRYNLEPLRIFNQLPLREVLSPSEDSYELAGPLVPTKVECIAQDGSRSEYSAVKRGERIFFVAAEKPLRGVYGISPLSEYGYMRRLEVRDDGELYVCKTRCLSARLMFETCSRDAHIPCPPWRQDMLDSLSAERASLRL